MNKKLYVFILVGLLAFTAACGSATTEPAKTDDAKTEKSDSTETGSAEKKEAESTDASTGDDTPTKAINEFVKAYQDKDVAALKKRFSKSTLEMMSKDVKAGETIDEALKQFVEADDMPIKGTPETRNEQINDDKATIEVKAEGKWEKTDLVKEDGMWKVDFGNMG